MILNAATKPEALGVQPRRAAAFQLTAGRKASGRIDPGTVNRFWAVLPDPKGGARGSKQPHPKYADFNREVNWKDPESVALRTTFQGVLRHASIEDVCDLSYYSFRGASGNPKGNRFKCRCDGSTAQRWNPQGGDDGKGGYDEIDLDGGRTCPCFMSAHAKRSLRLWFQPVWPEPLAHLERGLCLWATRARRSIDSFFGVIADVEQFAKDYRIPLTLVGMPFELQFAKRKGEGTEYPDIKVSFRGDIAEWAGWQRRTVLEIGGDSDTPKLLGPGSDPEEHEPEAVAEDFEPIIETRPAAVAVPANDVVEGEVVEPAVFDRNEIRALDEWLKADECEVTKTQATKILVAAAWPMLPKDEREPPGRAAWYWACGTAAEIKAAILEGSK